MPIDGPPCVPGYIDLCNVTARTDMFSPTASTDINTSTDPRCQVKVQTNGPDLCILYFTKVDIPASVTVNVIGNRALVLAATSSLSIVGNLDASSRRANPTRQGAASNHSTCAFLTTPENDGGGGGGGAGGTFATQGGAGGLGDLNDSNQQGGTASGGLPGTSVTDQPAILRGGCGGQKGGGSVSNGGGTGGSSGGAVYLFARGVINISGRVLANGTGGAGVPTRNGGGGGGSGGYVVIESETQSALSGSFLATGGGGGEGGATGATSGGSGGDPTSSAPADGGTGLAGGGNGGRGATHLNNAVVPAGIGQDEDGGGGGGGGGNGFIYVRGAGRMLTGTFAPKAIEPLQ